MHSPNKIRQKKKSIFLLINSGLSKPILNIKNSVQLFGLGFQTWPKANATLSSKLELKQKRQPKDFEPFKLNGFMWSPVHKH
jgi:hypothetical protein